LIETKTSTFLGTSKVGVSQDNSVSEIYRAATSFSVLPDANLTTIFYESLYPAPVMITLVFPVKGPKDGEIEKIA
jgi:hypothetical protein